MRETSPMRKPPTGEPYAGKPHVRFGGRGGESLPDPYQGFLPVAPGSRRRLRLLAMTVGERELPSRKSWPISHRLLGRETRKDGCGKGVLSEQFMSNQPARLRGSPCRCCGSAAPRPGIARAGLEARPLLQGRGTNRKGPPFGLRGCRRCSAAEMSGGRAWLDTWLLVVPALSDGISVRSC